MSTLLQLMQKPTTLVLFAGPGGDNPGAMVDDVKEAPQTRFIVGVIAGQLQQAGLSVDVVPADKDLPAALAYISHRHADIGRVWLVQVRRDATEDLSASQAALRCGALCALGDGAGRVGSFLKDFFAKSTGEDSCWFASDPGKEVKSLQWLRAGYPAAHLLEIGNILGDNSQAHLLKLASITAQALRQTLNSWDALQGKGAAPAPPSPTSTASSTPGSAGPSTSEAPAIKPVEKPAAAPETNPLREIGDDNFLSSAQRKEIPGGHPLQPRYVVIHYTEGFGAPSSVEGWQSSPDRERGILAHVVVDRDGTVYQCRAFNQTCGHAGDATMARWRDPKTNEFFDGANAHSIGIEIANTGMKTGLHASLNMPGHPKGERVEARHRNHNLDGDQASNEARSGTEWETYPQAQLDSVFALVKLLVKKYNLQDITGHDCVAPERKADPGPAFPMKELREANGFTGLPKVWGKKGNALPV